MLFQHGGVVVNMDLLLSILITLFLVGVVLSIAYIAIAFVLEKKTPKESAQQESPSKEALKDAKNERIPCKVD